MALLPGHFFVLWFGWLGRLPGLLFVLVGRTAGVAAEQLGKIVGVFIAYLVTDFVNEHVALQHLLGLVDLVAVHEGIIIFPSLPLEQLAQVGFRHVDPLGGLRPRRQYAQGHPARTLLPWTQWTNTSGNGSHFP